MKLFATVRLTQKEDSEPRDINIINNKEVEEEINEDIEYLLIKRYVYSREYKLAAIDYF